MTRDYLELATRKKDEDELSRTMRRKLAKLKKQGWFVSRDEPVGREHAFVLERRVICYAAPREVRGKDHSARRRAIEAAVRDASRD
jgi:hypothetical protein